MALLDRCEPQVLHRDFAACNEWEGKDSAPGVNCPTLVVSGAKDRMTPPRAGRALADRIGDGNGSADFITVADAGHMLIAEAPGPARRRMAPRTAGPEGLRAAAYRGGRLRIPNRESPAPAARCRVTTQRPRAEAQSVVSTPGDPAF